MSGSEWYYPFQLHYIYILSTERWEYLNTTWEVLVYFLRAYFEWSRTTKSCNYFYVCINWPLTCILIGIKAHLLEDKQISSVRVFDETKNVTFLGVSLSPNSCIIWLDFTQSRFFSHFRCFWRINHKRSIFGRFRSEKVRKTTKSQKTLKCTEGDGVTSSNVTTSGTTEVKNWSYSWRAR